MWRACFLAIGIYLCVLGAECLIVDRAFLSKSSAAEVAEDETQNSVFSPQPVEERKAFIPKEWMPWSMLSSGAVVILYSFTIPRRVSG